jgi:hypothetical protein
VKILDLSAGNRAVWFNKQHPSAVYVDCRPEVNPTIVADTRHLPPAVGADYDLIVFDPPHVNFGANARLSQDYGHHTTADIRDCIQGSAREAHRVSRLDALMAFKWNDHDQKLERVLRLLEPYWEPLFGHKVAQRNLRNSSTYWVMLRRVHDAEVSSGLLTASGESTESIFE